MRRRARALPHPPPRFAIREQHGSAAEKKIRLIVDFERSEMNSLLKLHDSIVHNTLGAMFAMARAFARTSPNAILMLTIMDFANAYKHIGVYNASTQFDVIALPDPKGGVEMAYLNTQPFGSRRAPTNWARVTQFVVFVHKQVFRVWLGVYVDNLFFLEPQAAIEPARFVVEELRHVL